MNDLSIFEKYDTKMFQSQLSEIGLSLEKRQICQFLRYYELLVEWNSFMNLTAITEYSEVLLKHFTDSLSIMKWKAESEWKGSLIDVGTGAGFPGIPLAIAFPSLQITLLDSLNKRINFLNTVVEELDLSNVTTIHSRAEDFVKQKGIRESFDFAVSRAVANLATLSEYCLPYVKVGGSFIAYKSEKAEEEISSAGNSIKILGGMLESPISFVLPESDLKRNLLVIRKNAATPKMYPRKAGLPSKEPLS